MSIWIILRLTGLKTNSTFVYSLQKYNFVQSKVKITGDGSATLYVPELDEHYHSTNGAVQESEHIFIERGLHALVKPTIRIFEFGFGTGLNALLTLLNGLDKSIVYHGLERFPLNWPLIHKLGYHIFLNLSAEEKLLFRKMHEGEWDKELLIKPGFKLKKSNKNLFDYTVEEKYDLVYFDAFAPAVQPELWKEEVFLKLFQALNDDGIMVTYCAKGEVRRIMQRVGFTMERLPGPPGKREMLRGVKREKGKVNSKL